MKSLRKTLMLALALAMMLIFIPMTAFATGDNTPPPSLPTVTSTPWNEGEVWIGIGNSLGGSSPNSITREPYPAATYTLNEVTTAQAEYFARWKVKYFVSTNKDISSITIPDWDTTICNVTPVGAIDAGWMAATRKTGWSAGEERDLLAEFGSLWGVSGAVEQEVESFADNGLKCGVVCISNDLLEAGTTLTVKMQIINPNDESESYDIVLDKYSLKPYTVSFDANGGEGNMDDVSLQGDIGAQLPANKFTRDGYEFAGWATSANGDKAFDDKGYIKKNSDITLYAKWNEIVPAESGEVKLYDGSGNYVQGFSNVQAAIDAVPDNSEGYTVQIMPESFDNGTVMLAETLLLNKSFILDLNGATLTKSIATNPKDKNPLIKAFSGDVEIKNGSITYDLSEYTGTGSTSNANVINVGMKNTNGVYSGGTCDLTLTNVAVSSVFPKLTMALVYVESGSFTMNSGSLSASNITGNTKDQYIIYTNTNNNTELIPQISIGGSASIDTNNCSGIHGIQIQKGNETLTISGNATITTTTASWKPNSYTTKYAYALNNQSGATCTITGGRFIGKVVQTKGNINTSGGLFSYPQGTSTSLVNKVTVAEGYEYVQNTDETTSATYPYVVRKAVTYVAQIGEVQYETLAAAIAAVSNDNTETTIEMIADTALEEGVTVTAGKNIVLELAGHEITETLSKSGTSALITNNGTLTIQDSSDTNKDGTGTGKISYQNANPDQGSVPGYASNTIINQGNLTIESGYVENTTTGGYAAYTVDNLTNGGSYTPVFTMNGGKLYNSYTDAVRMFLNSTTNLNKVVINGGVLNSGKANGRVVVIQDPGSAVGLGELDITGGTINGKVSAWSAANAGGVEDRFTDAQYAGISINISGGCIKELTFSHMANETLRAEALKVTGGVYEESPEAYVSSDYEVVDNTDEETKDAFPYKVENAFVAQIGETKYKTLSAAFAAANANKGGSVITIKLLADLDFSDSDYSEYKWAGNTYNPLVLTRGNVIIDLNGKTISNMGNCAIVLGNRFATDGSISNVTIKNGTLNVGSTNDVLNSYALGIAGVKGMTVKNVTTLGGINIYTASEDVLIDGCNITGTKYYSVCAQSGSDVIIEGTTCTKNTDSTVATKSMFWVQGAGKDEDMETSENPTGSFEASSIEIRSGTYNVNKENGGTFFLAGLGKINPVVYGGTYSIDPSNVQSTDCVAEGYESVALSGDKAGWYQVGKIKATELTPGIPTETEVTYTATKEVVDTETGVTIPDATQKVMNITVKTESGEIPTNLDQYNLDGIVTSALETADTDEGTIIVNLKVVSGVVETKENKIIYEVHPKATITVGDTVVGTFIVSNEDLSGKKDDPFTFDLEVPTDLITGDAPHYIKVTHVSGTVGTDAQIYTAGQDGTSGKWYVTVTTDHFSQFELEASTVAELGTAKIKANLSLEDEIKINFKVSDLNKAASNYKVSYSFMGAEPTIYNLGSLQPESGVYKFTVASCNAKQMTETVVFKVFYDNVEIFTVDYSIREYCKSKIDKSKDEKLVNLCRSVLDYGTYAQQYFGYLGNGYANSGGYGNSTLVAKVPEHDMSLSNISDNITVKANLSLESKTELNFKLITSNPSKIEGVSVTSPGSEETVSYDTRTSGDMMTIKVNGIASKYLNHDYTLTFYYDNGQASTVTYSPMAYAYRNQAKGNGLGEVCRALYKYWYDADKYFGN